jgi:glycine betaine/proline transport system substrate-binding protein
MLIRTLACSLICAFAAVAGAIAAPLGDSNDPIKVAVNDWTGQHITAHVYGSLLEKLGYKVEYVTAGMIPQYTGLSSGSLDAQPETWKGAGGKDSEALLNALKSGAMENVGELGLQANDGWVYTDATKSVCPGLPDWSALKDEKCADALATPDTFPKGRLLDYPADWGTVSQRELDNFEIPFQAIPAGSEAALVAELQAAAAADKPLLMRFWAPHWILSKIKVNWLKMPPCDMTGPNANPDCIIASTVIKTVWPGFSTKWPAAYEMTRKFTFSAEDQQQMIYAIDEDKKPLDSVVADWLTKNQATWSAWIKEAKE